MNATRLDILYETALQQMVTRIDNSAINSVLKDDATSLLRCVDVDVSHMYEDVRHQARITLLGLSILNRRICCMLTLLMDLDTDPDIVCAIFWIGFLRTTVPLTMTGRDFANMNEETRRVIDQYDLRRAQLRATQWALVNIPACWRDLSEDVLKRFRYA